MSGETGTDFDYDYTPRSLTSQMHLNIWADQNGDYV
jgi:hypothetical protein